MAYPALQLLILTPALPKICNPRLCSILNHSSLTYSIPSPPLLHSSYSIILTQGPQLVQMYIGDGAKLVRDAFDLAKEKILKEGRKVDIV